MRRTFGSVLLLLLPGLAAADPPPTRAAAAGLLDLPGAARRAFTGARPPEFVEMLLAIVNGSKMGPGDGWFHPGQARHDWKWPAARLDANGDGKIERREFRGPAAWFD